MVSNEDLEKRIEYLEKEVKHLKAVLQYQMRNKKKWDALLLVPLIVNKWKPLQRDSYTINTNKILNKKSIINCLIAGIAKIAIGYKVSTKKN